MSKNCLRRNSGGKKEFFFLTDKRQIIIFNSGQTLFAAENSHLVLNKEQLK